MIERARRKVGVHLGLFLGRQDIECEQPGELECLVVTHRRGPHATFSNSRRSADSPSLTRLLTVPRGTCSRSAISVWVNPLKYASWIAWRCASGSVAIA